MSDTSLPNFVNLSGPVFRKLNAAAQRRGISASELAEEVLDRECSPIPTKNNKKIILYNIVSNQVTPHTTNSLGRLFGRKITQWQQDSSKIELDVPDGWDITPAEKSALIQAICEGQTQEEFDAMFGPMKAAEGKKLFE